MVMGKGLSVNLTPQVWERWVSRSSSACTGPWGATTIYHL